MQKELAKLTSAHQQLIEDQKVLQHLHEQLNAEYDSLVQERESLKNTLKDTRAEKRNLLEKYMRMKATCNNLEAEKENFKKDSDSLINLRTEHSKLKVGFWRRKLLEVFFLGIDSMKRFFNDANFFFRV